jgi:thioredoxin-dependent peroxiredoxin
MTNLPPPQQLPDLVVQSTHGAFNLKEMIGKLLVLYFYPKDATSGCSIQARDFRDLMPAFAAQEIQIIGVSRDSLKSHDKFSTNECLPFALISDPEETLCRHFDVIQPKNMYGKTVYGIQRSTFIFNTEGQLIHALRKVKAVGHAQDILDLLCS